MGTKNRKKSILARHCNRIYTTLDTSEGSKDLSILFLTGMGTGRAYLVAGLDHVDDGDPDLVARRPQPPLPLLLRTLLLLGLLLLLRLLRLRLLGLHGALEVVDHVAGNRKFALWS